MVTRAADIQAGHQWQSDPFDGSMAGWSQRFRKNKAAVGFSLAAFLLVIGWSIRGQHWLSAEQGVGYALGIVSVGCMMILLLYPLRKRFRILKFIGPLPKWFRNHMILGTTAPIAALYHCNFQLGSLNSRIALFSALTVAGSGLVGRFIYSKIHHGLYGRKATLKERLAQVKATTPGVGKLGTIVPELRARMSQFDRQVLVPPKGILECIRLPLVLAVKTRLHYWRLLRFTRLSLMYQASRSDVVAEHKDKLERVIGLYIREHLDQVRSVASFVAYDRLFKLWHKVHFPFFVVLLVTVIVHIAVVYLY